MTNNGDTLWAVYILGGQWEDAWEAVIGIYSTKEEADSVANEFNKWHYYIDDNERLIELGEELCDKVYYDDEIFEDGEYNFHGSLVRHINSEGMKKYGITDEDAGIIQLSYKNSYKEYSLCLVQEYELGKTYPE